MDLQISEQDIGSGIFLLQRFKSTWTVTCWSLTSFPSDLWLSSTSFSFLTRKQKMVNFVLKIVIPASSVIKTSIANWFHVFWQFQILAIWWNIFHKIIRLLWNFRYRRIYLILKSLLTLNHFWDKGIKPDWIRVPKIYTWEKILISIYWNINLVLDCEVEYGSIPSLQSEKQPRLKLPLQILDDQTSQTSLKQEFMNMYRLWFQ